MRKPTFERLTRAILIGALVIAAVVVVWHSWGEVLLYHAIADEEAARWKRQELRWEAEHQRLIRQTFLQEAEELELTPVDESRLPAPGSQTSQSSLPQNNAPARLAPRE